MTNALATRDESSIELLPPARRQATAAIEMLQGHADMMQMAYNLAKNICRTQLVPARFRGKTDDATAAILYGAELGLNPIQSLQRVIPIHGQPTIESRTMVALLKTRGYKIRTTAQSNESVTVWGQDLDGEEYESTWTIERATRAGYVPRPATPDSLQRPEVDDDWVTVTKTFDGRSKVSVLGNMKYITDPQAMLKAKAQAEVCRDMAPDVLLGIAYSTEDMDSERLEDRYVQSERPVAEEITVEEILDGAAEQQRSFRDKVQPPPAAPADEPAAGDADSGQDGGNDASQGQQPSEAQAEADSRDQEGGGAEPAEEAPAEEVAAEPATEAPRPPVFSADRTGAMSVANRQKWIDGIETLLRDANVENGADQVIVAGEILGRRLDEGEALPDADLKKLGTTLDAWNKLGTLTAQVDNAINTFCARAEQTVQNSLDLDGTE